MKKLMFALLTVSAVGFVSLPVMADEGDSVNLQDSTQVTTQQGNHNRSTQGSEQRINETRNGTGNTGNAQGTFQDNFQEGNRNTSSQRNEQNIRHRDR